ncbi:MAG TPA: type I-U CRISPR-associated protein Csb2 [Streptosporangiaceae bacterium]|nr:type I-U CRISPR-associated protein Csb2 [Streptosporangiaceae bacterium]
MPSRDWFAIVWPLVDPPSDVKDLLETLAWRVPYVGRSTSRAQMSVRCSLPAEPHDGVIYGPAGVGAGIRSVGLRVPYPGYAGALRGAYSSGARSWEVSRTRPYCEVSDTRGEQSMTAMAVPSTQGPFDELLVWTIERPAARIGGDLVVALASSLRRAVLSRVPDPIPAQVSGHGAPGRQHVSFLALPDVAHDYADGHVLGLALAIPRDLPEPDVNVLLKALFLEPPLTRIGISGGRVLAVRYGADKAGLRPARWSASSRNGRREWVTTTPMMLDGHTRRGRDEADEVARALVIAGYPRPVDVEVSGTAMVTGGIWRPRPSTVPPGRPRRRLVHARVRFGDPVIGPVLAGSMRYLGLGLFSPLTSARAARVVRDSAQVPAGVK